MSSHGYCLANMYFGFLFRLLFRASNCIAGRAHILKNALVFPLQRCYFGEMIGWERSLPTALKFQTHPAGGETLEACGYT